MPVGLTAARTAELRRSLGRAAPSADLARGFAARGKLEQALAHWQCAAAESPQDAEPLYQLGRTSYRLGRFGLAAQSYRGALALAPTRTDALLGLARALTMQDDQEALAVWAMLLTLDVGKEEALISLSRLGLKAGRAEEVRQWIAGHGGNRLSAELQILYGRALTESGAHAEAEAVFTELIGSGREQARAWAELARLHQKQRRWSEALLDWREVLTFAADNPEALYATADCLIRLERLEDALALWEARARALPNSAEAHLRAARIHVTRKNREEALACYRRALVANPEDGRVLGEVVQFLGNSAHDRLEAVELCLKWQKLKPGAIEPVLQLARLFELLNLKDQAEALLEQAVGNAPADARVHAARARFYRRQERHEEVVQAAQRWLGCIPSSTEAHITKADALVNLGRDQEAECCYRDLLAGQPDNLEALLGVARICWRLRRPDEAITLWRRVRTFEPSNVEAWSSLVANLANSDREADALAEFEAAKPALGENPKALLARAEMLDKGRFVDLTSAAYEAAIAAAPEQAEPRWRYGRFLIREGRLGAALEQLALAREREPGSVPIALDTIEVLETLAYLGVGSRPISAVPQDLLIPERYFERISAIAAQSGVYDPVPGRVVMLNQALGPGGAERQLVTTIRGLRTRREVESVTLICNSLDPRTQRNFYLADVIGSGCDVVLPNPADLRGSEQDELVRRNAELIRRLPADMGPIGFWVREFRRRRPEIVHAWQDMTSLSAAVAALIAGVPKIFLGTRSVRPDNPRRRLRRWMQVAYRNILDVPRVRMLNNSRAGALDYADWLGLLPDEIAVIYNGLDTAALVDRLDAQEPARIRERLGIAPKAPVVGGVLRLSEEKRPLLWVETAARVAERRADAHFVVCGEGPFAAEMAAVAAASGFSAQLHLVGNQPNIAPWFGAMDALLLTSRHEGLPNVLIEAQSFGIPVVVPAVGGAPEVLLDGRTGFAVPRATADSLADRLLHCLQDQAWRAEAGPLAIQFARERFSIEAMIARTLDVYGLTAATDGVEASRTERG